MKKYLIPVLCLMVAFAYATPKTPTYKSSQYVNTCDGENYKMLTWSLPTMYTVGSGGACTLNMINGTSQNEWHADSKFTLLANFRTNNTDATADSGDIIVRIKVGTDSANYYWPVADSAHMIAANGRMKQYTDLTAGDSIYTYTAYSIDAPAATTGLSLAIPLNLPAADIMWKRMQIIFVHSKAKSADTGTIANGFILEKRPLMRVGTDSWR